MAKDYRPALRRLSLAGLYLLAVVWGLSQPLMLGNGPLRLLIPILFAVEATGWCILDSRLRGRPLLPILQKLIFFTWPVSVPLYLVGSRGFRGVGLACLHAFGLLVTCVLAFWLGLLLTQ